MDDRSNKKRGAQPAPWDRTRRGEKPEEDDEELDELDDIEEDIDEVVVENNEDDEDMDDEEREKRELDMVETDNRASAINDQPHRQIFRPGVDKLEEDEVLDYDPEAYLMLHKIEPEWPCLSFDIFPDKLGVQRTRFPHTVYWVAGTQADVAENNKLLVFKASRLCRTNMDEEDDDEEVDEDPILEFRHHKVSSGINRVMPQEPHIVATWTDQGSVNLYNVSDMMKALDTPPTGKLPDPLVKTLTAHKTEGFAMSWSSLVPGRLLTGDCDGGLHLTELQNNTIWYQDTNAFKGHKSSIEDIQWSPTESEVFATCSSDGSVKIWDARMKKTSARSFEAANCDVNSLAWNKKVMYLLASGAEDGSFRIWDLRSLKGPDSKCESIAHFKWHSDQVTSLEWDPYDESTIAVSGADGQITIWDMSVEKDTEESGFNDVDDIPPQLLFVHQGQSDTKELHFHSQIPGVLLSTAEDGFDIFKPSIETEVEER